MEHSAGVVESLTDCYSGGAEFGPGRVDICDGEV
jgi:hypothetical protein